MNDKVAVIGLGFVGLTLALFLSRKVKNVTGFDTEKKKIEDLKNGRTYFHENGLDELLIENLNQTFFPKSLDEDTPFFDWIFVTVGTPLKSGKPNLSYLFKTVDFVCSKAAPNAEILLRSTVPVGITKEYSDLIMRIRPDLNVSFCPERTIEGKAIEELQNLPQILASRYVERNKKILDFFDQLDINVVELETTEEAELIKLFSNIYRDLHFSIANLFDEISSSFGLNGSSIINAANRSYDRNNIPKPGFVAGPCLSKDAQLLASSLDDDHLSKYVLAGRKINSLRIDRLTKRTLDCVGSNGTVLIYGLAFKGQPETDDIRDSQSLEFIKQIRTAEMTTSILLYDPVATAEQIRTYFDEERIFNGEKVDVVVRLNNHSSFDQWLQDNRHCLNEGATIIDTWE